MAEAASQVRIAHILVCHSLSPARLLASIPPREETSWYVFLHGRSPAIAREAAAFCRARGGRLFPHKTNRGLARSWNDAIARGMAEGCGAFLLLNDDLVFDEGGYDSFRAVICDSVRDHPEIAFVTTLGREGPDSHLAGEIHAQSFACGALTRSAIERIGYFDETFVPAYYEDIDYFARMMNTDMVIRTHPHVVLEHERSATTRSLPPQERDRLAEARARNHAYMIEKWGSDDPEAAWAHPFGNPALDLRIARERRRRPWGPPPSRAARAWRTYRDRP